MPDEPAPTHPGIPSEPHIIDVLPEITICIFNDYLKADDNLRSRRVCRFWNHVLTSRQASSRVHIACTDDCGEIELATLLFKMVTSATHIVHITGNGFPAPLRTLPAMLAAMKVKLPVISVKNVCIMMEDILDCSHADAVYLNSLWQSVCGKLMLVGVGWKGNVKNQDVKMADSLVSGMVGDANTVSTLRTVPFLCNV
ncbi:uncharacterized protein LOC129582699 [Paramacrobiotus metropolitanus]|uniref:uncharacterized protein LOC129582699 n=1 Tax=Paramacrobiotus metropolitanus TaxID=2943436 RepID=UPI0024458CC4|nr:uncharacterized protein LOC129582699 [Paramacrobiotus metropolitanus]